ncbi:MAG: hemerythrin domain-containing protein, partial [Desulfobacterales bacterium]|nr:hemerythrin domain-containing protein [Desulfobacterales bacterium]
MIQSPVSFDSTDHDWFEVFPWNSNFETGHPRIDQQHKKLVTLLNQLAKTLITNEILEVNSAFTELTQYANRHFEEEERIWINAFGQDPWVASHQMSHASFLPKVIEIKDQKTDQS